jgi:dihydroorotate dehydrogenase electron transfer subunit
MPQDLPAPVLRNLDLGHRNFLLELHAPALAAQVEPGQFFMLGVPGAEILLRRPFSVCGARNTFVDTPAEALQILYKVVGKGTALMAALRAGAIVQTLGPLGHAFHPPAPEALPVFVAGGIGSAPFPALAKSLRGRVRIPWMLYGARTAADLPLLDWFREHCERVEVTTEDGSAGEKGRVTAPLARLLATSAPGSLQIYACGPNPMLAAVTRLVRAHGMPCDLSLEAPMACGFGVCLGCVVACHAPEGGTRFERVCVEGPILRAEHLAW